jgi:hypothetical protein
MLSFVDMNTVRNALAPLEFIVTALGGLLIFVVLLLIPVTVFGSGTFLGFGESETCIDAPFGGVPGAASSGHVTSLRDGAAAHVSQLGICDLHPSGHQLFLQIGTLLPEFVFFVGLLLAIWLTLRTARTRGLFSPHVALDVLRLGVYLLAGSLAAAALQAEASSRLLSTMVNTNGESGFFTFFDMPWAAIIVAFACLTIARTLAQAVRMQREIDATV